MPDRIDPQSLNPKHVAKAVLAHFGEDDGPLDDENLRHAIAAYLNAVREDDEAMQRGLVEAYGGDRFVPEDRWFMRAAFTAAVTVPPCERCGGTQLLAGESQGWEEPCPVCGVREEADRDR